MWVGLNFKFAATCWSLRSLNSDETHHTRGVSLIAGGTENLCTLLAFDVMTMVLTKPHFARQTWKNWFSLFCFLGLSKYGILWALKLGVGFVEINFHGKCICDNDFCCCFMARWTGYWWKKCLCFPFQISYLSNSLFENCSFSLWWEHISMAIVTVSKLLKAICMTTCMRNDQNIITVISN